jgi:hypothetical protein
LARLIEEIILINPERLGAFPALAVPLCFFETDAKRDAGENDQLIQWWNQEQQISQNF